MDEMGQVIASSTTVKYCFDTRSIKLSSLTKLLFSAAAALQIRRFDHNDSLWLRPFRFLNFRDGHGYITAAQGQGSTEV